MAEYTYNPVQTVEPNQNVILNDSIPCPRGYVLHRNESGLVTLRGVVNNPCGCFARYQCVFNANIGIPDGSTPTEIGVALALGGEIIQTSKALYTPADAEVYGNVTSSAIITVPKGCCFTVAVENASVSDDATALPPAILVQNASLIITRIA